MSAEQGVDAIIRDIEDRRGLGDAWDQIDEETQGEIRDEWIEIIRYAARS